MTQKKQMWTKEEINTRLIIVAGVSIILSLVATGILFYVHVNYGAHDRDKLTFNTDTILEEAGWEKVCVECKYEFVATNEKGCAEPCKANEDTWALCKIQCTDIIQTCTRWEWLPKNIPENCGTKYCIRHFWQGNHVNVLYCEIEGDNCYLGTELR